MQYVFLKNYINQYSNNKIQIIKYWISNKELLSILKKHNMKREIFVKKYAFSILDYYIDVVNSKVKIGDCPIIDELIIYLKNNNINSSELFILCTAFKNSLIELTYDLKISCLQIENEINYIFEQNFAGVLEKYSKTVNSVSQELSKTTKIIDNYIIMSSTDVNGIITHVSEAFCNISGFTKEELLGKTHSLIRHEDMEDEVFGNLWETILSGNIWQGEVKNKKKNGGYFWVDVIITPNYDTNNNIISFDAIRQDISSKKELEEQQSVLIEQSKSAAMGEMISMIAHQWRQPLQAVSILIQKLPLNKMIDGEISDELLDQVVDDVGTQLQYMSKTIDDFRDFFLPGKAQETTSVNVIIDKSLDFLSMMIKTDSISVNMEAKTTTKVTIHLNEIVQVLINLIKNARDVMIERKIEHKELNILYYEENKCLIIEIEDNAGGVPDELLTKIFEPYFSTKSDKNGTGLGLYMCKTIIEKHCNGKISVDNSNLGAVFKIELPIFDVK
jgi:PAS domain S-box-containing protein